MLTAVLPTLNAASSLPAAIAALRPAVDEIIVADGGSTDASQDVARQLGARVIAAPRGRGPQLVAGTQAAAGDWLLFLHADTVLQPGWHQIARSFIAATGDQPRAACFRFALDDDSAAAARLEALVAWRCRVLALPYGDQGLLLSRAFYQRLGGFRPLPLMEDVDLVRRIGRRRLEMLPAAAVTSAARYRRDGYLWRPARNLMLLSLYFAGVAPRLLARLYG